MLTSTDPETVHYHPDPPTRERIERARRKQWQAIKDLRRRILDSLERRYQG